ncbi:MAG: TonB-dependent receptor [Treponema sp.]|jgi:vitamin B12 transporter|nr:TonB-dependent receptor [Treponema sp.]
MARTPRAAAAVLAAALLAAPLVPCPAQGGGGEFDDYRDFGEDERGVTITPAPKTTGQIRVITREEIERRNPRDLSTLLEEELDMSVTRTGAYGNQADLSLRGFDTERIAILIDGVPANSPRSGEFDVSQIDMTNVERVEVIYGGSDTRYNVSGALGGVINIITVKKQGRGLHLGAAVSNTGYLPGRYNRRRAGGAAGGPEFVDLVDTQSLSVNAGYGAERFSWRGSLFGNRAGNHYLYADDYGFARRKESNEALDGGGNASLVWDLGETSTFLSDTRLYHAGRNFPITMNSTGKARATDFQLTESLQLNAPLLFGDRFGTEASVSYQFTRAVYGVDISSRDHYVNALNRWNWFARDGLTLRAGWDWRFLHVDADSPTETDPVKTGNQGGLYLTGEYTPVKNLTLAVSVKGVTDTRRAVPVPKIGFRWAALEWLVLKNNYFRGFKFPDFDDLYYRSHDGAFAGNPNLRPEDGWGFDLTAELPLSRLAALEGSSVVRALGVTATGWGQYTRDSIHWVKSRGGRWSPENVGTAWLAGFDVRPSLTLALGRAGRGTLKAAPSYQFQMSWLLNGDLGFADSFRIPYAPTHILGCTLDLGWKTGSLLLSAHYETTRYADTLNQMPLDPHLIVHATANQRVGKGLTLFASLRNILNARYESFAGYYMPGISLTLGVKTRLDKWPAGDGGPETTGE